MCKHLSISISPLLLFGGPCPYTHKHPLSAGSTYCNSTTADKQRSGREGPPTPIPSAYHSLPAPQTLIESIRSTPTTTKSYSPPEMETLFGILRPLNQILGYATPLPQLALNHRTRAAGGLSAYVPFVGILGDGFHASSLLLSTGGCPAPVLSAVSLLVSTH